LKKPSLPRPLKREKGRGRERKEHAVVLVSEVLVRGLSQIIPNARRWKISVQMKKK
jgi:hypothetical protein